MELMCEFSVYSSLSTDDQPQYKCVVTNVHRIASNGRVLAVHGLHVKDKSNADVHSVTIFNHELNVFPRYLCSFFPNLRSVSVVGCGIRSLSRLDLVGFEGVEKLMLNGNRIRTLPADVFDFARHLESVSFFDNCIEFIDEEALEPLTRLKYLNLKMNTSIDLCVNEFAHVRMSMEQLKGFIKIKFGGRRFETNDKVNRKLSETLRFLENFIESSRILVEDNFNNNNPAVNRN